MPSKMPVRFLLRNDARAAGARHADAPSSPEPYLASKELVKAVNLAIFLRRPLLLEGEAGCGKSRLARAVAHELGLPCYTWSVRSSSRVQEGLYSYDSILRLHDVQTSKVEGQGKAAAGKSKPSRDPANPRDYRSFGALGKAFSLTDCPAVVLIDEIDKADIDFPNDLLTVLDDPWSFVIPETGETIAANESCRPIVIITSNKEKGNLPAPFLRRCVYYYLDFPEDSESLKAIVRTHYEPKKPSGTSPSPSLLDAAAERFLEIRKKDLHKKPGTSEFLDWLDSLVRFESAPFDPKALRDVKRPLPHPEVLFKLRSDWLQYSRTP